MKKSYAIVLALFCFGLMSSTVDELNIFNQNIHDIGVNRSTINQIDSQVDTMANVSTVEDNVDELSIFSIGKGLAIGIKIILFAFGKTIVIYFTLVSYGVSTASAGMVQGMVTLVEGIAVVEFMLNRRATQ